jgi:hypothetical protein
MTCEISHRFYFKKRRKELDSHDAGNFEAAAQEHDSLN